MSFGRWLLVHSFSIFLLLLLTIAYVYRAELQLEKAYQQLLNIDPKSVTISSRPPDQTSENQQVDEDVSTKKAVVVSTLGKDHSVTPTLHLKALPTVPSVIEGSIQTDPAEKPIDRLEALLFKARGAYWSKNYADAIRYYQELILTNRDNPDYLGELGNIYYSLNDNQNASRLYYQAAQLFINQNQPEKARLLVSPIIAMNRELGDQLKRQLQ